jgi:lipoate-protein ligase A
MGDKKILGSSLYRNASQVLYHQVLLVDAPLEPMMRYLRHPSREPDYRQGRPHHDFVVSLRGEGYAWSVLEIQEAVQRKFEGWGFGAEGGLGRRKGGRVDSTLPQRFEEP